jgi:hypothetical protein
LRGAAKGGKASFVHFPAFNARAIDYEKVCIYSYYFEGALLDLDWILQFSDPNRSDLDPKTEKSNPKSKAGSVSDFAKFTGGERFVDFRIMKSSLFSYAICCYSA